MLLLMFEFNCIASILKSHKINNLFISHFWTPIEYTLLAIIFYENVRGPVTKRLIAWSIPVVILFVVYLTVYIEGLSENNSYAGVICNLLIIAMALAYLYELLLSANVIKFQYHPLCWLSIGLLMYSCGNLVTQGPLNFLMSKDMKLAFLVYHFGYMFSVLYFLSILAASVFASKTKLPND